MTTRTRREAQQRADRIAQFRAELAQLEQEQGLVLTREQRAGLDAHLDGVLSELRRQFDVDATDSSRRISWGMRVVFLLGLVALFAAAVLFLHRVWGSLSTPVHVGVLVAAPLLLLTATEVVFRRRIDPYYTGLLALAAGVSFVMALGALGTVLNLVPFPESLCAWALFALLLGTAYGVRLLLGAGLVLVCACVAALGMVGQGDHWASFLERAGLLVPPAVAVYGIPWLRRGPDPLDFATVFRLCGAGTGLLALFALSTSGHLCCGGVSPRMAEVLYELAGMGAGAGVVAHGLRLGRASLVNLGAGAFVVFLYVRLHAWWWQWMPKYLFFLLMGLVAVGLLLVFRRLRRGPVGGGDP